MEKQNKQEFPLSPGRAISPIDGRYYGKTKELSDIFSEFALMRYRVTAEIEWLIALDEITNYQLNPQEIIIRELTTHDKMFLRDIYIGFSYDSYLEIKELESTTNHDVKAVEYFIKKKLMHTSVEDLKRFVHLGLTSEDVNNLAFGFGLRDGVDLLYDNFQKLHTQTFSFAVKGHNVPLLALTHGQPASPTTLEWEMLVFAERLRKNLKDIEDFKLLIKWGGATGGHNALNVAYPKTNWQSFSKLFIEGFNLNTTGHVEFVYNGITDQIEPHDTYAKLFNRLKEINTGLIDFAKDMWGYISRGDFVQEKVAGEVGSSTMPHKINPINFENAEGNLGVANALFTHFADKLPISRFQRDLSDSTVIRYFGTAFGANLIAIKALMAGIKRLSLNHQRIYEELDSHWEVIGEAYQIILKREGIEEAYELMAAATKNLTVTREDLLSFIDQAAVQFNLRPKVVEELKAITPHNYIGDRSIP